MPKKKEDIRAKKNTFTHVHVREEGVLTDEVREERFAGDMDDIEKGLRAIYKGDDKDLGVVTKDRSGLTRMLGKLIFFLLAVLCAGILGLFAWNWWQNAGSTENAVEVQIFAPESIKSGDEVNVEIAYKNPRSIALAQLVLDVNLPQGFEIRDMSPSPTNEEQLVWNIGTLGRNSDGKIVLTGRWYADIPEQDRIQVVTTYRPANFNADFSVISSAEISITESVLGVTLSGPERANVGEQVTYTAMFTNTGNEDEQVGGEFVLPEGFIPRSWDPELPPGQGTAWELGTIVPGNTVIQTVVGSYASEVDDLQEMSVVGYIKTTKGRTYTQKATSWLTDVQGGAVSVALAGNGSTSSVSLTPGDQLRLSVQLANISQSDVADASILLDFQPESGIPIAWSEAIVGKAKITAAGVVLAAGDVGSIAKTERKTFSLLFPIKNEITSTQASSFTVTAFVTSGGVTVQSLPLSVAINANVGLSSAAKYYDESGTPLGSGIFPPRAGQETTFVLNWAVMRALHAVQNATVTAILPQNVQFSAVRNTSLGSISYNETSRTLTWSISELPTDVSIATAQIEIVYTPSEADVDEYGKLLSGTAFRGEDGETHAVITTTAGEVTTEMPEDSFANGKGIVQE